MLNEVNVEMQFNLNAFGKTKAIRILVVTRVKQFNFIIYFAVVSK